jgi:hypothetical protein
MAEAEFVSDLLLAAHEGISAGGQPTLDAAYKDYDDELPGRELHEKRFRDTMDIIGAVLGEELAQLEFRAIRLFYPLFCAVYHMKFGLPEFDAKRAPIKAADYPKLRIALEAVDELLDRIKTAETKHKDPGLTIDQRKFYEAFDEHWVHLENRRILTDYICNQFLKALKG